MSIKFPQGVGRIVHAEIDSTNAEAARIAASLSGPTWILALSQTAARGRRGRPWAHQQGNFSATLVMQPTETPDRVALRSFVTSLALYDAFVAVTGRTDGLALKWPNDVLMQGGKVAGILLESIGIGSGVNHLAIGIGVNLLTAPDSELLETKAVAPVSLAGAMGVQVSPEDFLDVLAASYAKWETQFVTYGFEPIRTAWLARAARLGERIIARTTREEFEGTFDTVDEQGALVLLTAQGRVSIPAGDVFF